MSLTARKLVAEFVGTFMLVFLAVGAAIFGIATVVGVDGRGPGSGVLGIAFAFGLVLFAVAYAFGPVSGGHVNPAVTLASQFKGPASAFGSEGSVLADFAREWTFLAKAFPRTAGQLFCQLLGATLAARLFLRLFPEER